MIKDRIAAVKTFVLENPVACAISAGIVVVIAVEAINTYRPGKNYTREELESMMFDATSPESIALIDRAMALK